MDHMAVSKVDRVLAKEMAVALTGDRVTVATDSKAGHKTVLASLGNRALIVTHRTLGMATSPLLMASKVPMVARGKEETAMDSKAPMVARDMVVVVVVAAVAAVAAAADMEARGKEVVAIADGVKQVMVVLRVGGLDVTKETAQKEGATEAEAVAAMTVAAMTAVVDLTAADTTVADEVDLLVWEVVTVVATKITVALETTAQGMNQLVSRTTLTTTPFLSRDWEKRPQFRKSVTSSSKLVSSR